MQKKTIGDLTVWSAVDSIDLDECVSRALARGDQPMTLEDFEGDQQLYDAYVSVRQAFKRSEAGDI